MIARRLFENHFPFAAETLRPALVAFAAMDDNDEWNDDLVVDAAQMREATPCVMERYAIPADRSSDLREDGGNVTLDTLLRVAGVLGFRVEVGT